MGMRKGVIMPKRKCYNIKCDDYNEQNENNCIYPDDVYYCLSYVSEVKFKQINEEVEVNINEIDEGFFKK